LTLAQGCLIQAQGCLTPAQGCLTLAQGCLTLAQGCLTLAQGCLTLAQGCLTLAQGCLTLAQGCSRSTGNIQAMSDDELAEQTEKRGYNESPAPGAAISLPILVNPDFKPKLLKNSKVIYVVYHDFEENPPVDHCQDCQAGSRGSSEATIARKNELEDEISFKKLSCDRRQPLHFVSDG